MRISVAGAIILLIFTAASTCAFAQITEEDMDVLRGLAEVVVEVERLKPEIERDGLYLSTLQTDAELKLEMAGMKILDKELHALDAPRLVLQVNVLKCSGGYVYATRVALREPVMLLRKRVRISGTTLRVHGQFGITSHLSEIREEARDVLDNFIRLWQEANTKSP